MHMPEDGSLLTPPACSKSQLWVCMLQVLLYPSKFQYGANWEGDCEWGAPGPQCGDAVGVQVTCRFYSSHHNKSAFALLEPELGSGLNEAAQRALDSLDVALPDFEHDYGEDPLAGCF